MKIFSWMNSKINAKQETIKTKPVLANSQHIRREPTKEEFSDWPHGLLAIGTFGNKENPKRRNLLECFEAYSEDHLQYITFEEVGEFEKELKLILDKQVVQPSSTIRDHDDVVSKDHLVSRGLDIHSCFDSKNKANGKKDTVFYYLLKKLFLSRIEFRLTPSLRDWSQESRMKKMLRAIWNKKKFPSSSKATSAQAYLQNKQHCRTDDEFEEVKSGSKWVNTDSEFIVLEI